MERQTIAPKHVHMNIKDYNPRKELKRKLLFDIELV
jgi:hypothetical protein